MKFEKIIIELIDRKPSFEYAVMHIYSKGYLLACHPDLISYVDDRAPVNGDSLEAMSAGQKAPIVFFFNIHNNKEHWMQIDAEIVEFRIIGDFKKYETDIDSTIVDFDTFLKKLVELGGKIIKR